MTKTVRASFTCEYIFHITAASPVPQVVLLRQELNRRGFKFSDDGYFSSIINTDPKPLGTMTVWRDEETMTAHYEQVLEGE